MGKPESQSTIFGLILMANIFLVTKPHSHYRKSQTSPEKSMKKKRFYEKKKFSIIYYICALAAVRKCSKVYISLR